MITSFSGEHFFLSNFYRLPDGKTVEHYYQAAKAASQEDYYRVLESSTPRAAKTMGRSIKVRGDWDSVKLRVMEYLLRLKFKEGTELARKLLRTGTEEILEGNYWGDLFWGVSSTALHVGENHLGKILMKIRGELASRSDCLFPGEGLDCPFCTGEACRRCSGAAPCTCDCLDRHSAAS